MKLSNPRTSRSTTPVSSLNSRSKCCHTKSVAVRVFKVALASSETLLVDRNPELRRHCVDVHDIQMDERVRPRVTFVFREIKPNASARNRYKQWEAWLELMLPLLTEAQSFIPRHRAAGVLDIQDRDDLFFHATKTYRAEPPGFAAKSA